MELEVNSGWFLVICSGERSLMVSFIQNHLNLQITVKEIDDFKEK